MSSFTGKIKEYLLISIDRFDGRNLASTAYFLSHFHSDHMVGLGSPSFLDHLQSNSGFYLYCSPITARFLQASIRHRPLDPYVVPILPGETVRITVPNIVEESGHQLSVTLISAGHCPGSVMFLFEGKGGTVLYTGDFRCSFEEIERVPALHNIDGTVKTLNSVHIDTTFCHRQVMHFPSREESAAAVGDLVEEWLAQGNNHLIHLVCPAKYGYEYVYQNLHERFNMRVHVSRWKYRMYDTVPEIQEALTPDATTTWIHACDWRINEADDGEDSGVRQLPCRCVPYGVDTAPKIRVIKPSAMFYTVFQSAKEIRQVSQDGSFCRVLLSMHASCSEILGVVSYLRPRKVYPNVIPMNSSKEEVLKLLHDALSRSGDHYSIEYGGSQPRGLGPFKRQLMAGSSSGSGSCTLEGSLLEGFLMSPNKRRRHSDSNMALALPLPRENMKGSLSLEGEAVALSVHIEECQGTMAAPEAPSKSGVVNATSPSADSSLVWVDPYSQSPMAMPEIREVCLGNSNACAVNLVPIFNKVAVDKSVEMSSKYQNLTKSLKGNKYQHNWGEPEDSCVVAGSSHEEDVFTEDNHKEGREQSIFLDEDDVFESDVKRCRRRWYRHKHFSTPVRDEGGAVDPVRGGQLVVRSRGGSGGIGPRSVSLPLPRLPNDLDILDDDKLPLITVSSPGDPLILGKQTVVNRLCLESHSEPSLAIEREVIESESVTPPFSPLVRPTVICATPLKTSPCIGRKLGPSGGGSLGSSRHSDSSPSDLSSPGGGGGEVDIPGSSLPGTAGVNSGSMEIIDLVSDSDCTPDLNEFLLSSYHEEMQKCKSPVINRRKFTDRKGDWESH